MNRRICIFSLSLSLAPCAGAQTSPMDRAEILGELAQGQSASYLAHLVQSRGTDFAPTADFLEHVRLSGGEGILIERLTAAEPRAGSAARNNEHPFGHLAKCSELIHVGAVEQAVSECRAAVDEDPESAWPNLLLLRVRSESGITPEERVKLLRRAAEAAPNLAGTHRALAMEEIPAEERHEEMEKAVTLEGAEPDGTFGAVDTTIFDHRSTPSPPTERMTAEKQKQLRSYIETTLRDYGDLAAAHLAVSAVYVSLGEEENARSQIVEALRLEPGNPELHIALAKFYESHHQAESGLAEFRAAAKLAPYQNLPHRYLGEALVREQRMDEAIEQWKDLLSLSPRDLQASNELIAMYLYRPDRTAAIAELRRSLKASSDVTTSEAEFVDARFQDLDRLARLLSEDRQFEAAEQQYAYLLRFKPDSSELHDHLGNVFYAQRRSEEAVSEYREAVRLEENSASAHQHLANCLLAMQKTDEAVAEYRQALELDPADLNSIAKLAVALTQKGEFNAAIEQFERYLAEDPKNGEVRASLAHAQCLNKDYGGAIDELHRALSADPELPVALDELASIYLTAEDPHFRNAAEALRLARRAVQSSTPPWPGFLDTLAEALLQNGEVGEAVQNEEQAAKLAPHNPEIQKRLAHLRQVVGLEAADAHP